MAEIQIIYRKGYCGFNSLLYSTECHTCTANDIPCEYYLGEKTDGHCQRALFKYCYKGWGGKKYHMEEVNDQYNPHLDCMRVTLGYYTSYECVKVTLDGKCIYDNHEYEEAGDDD